MTRAGKLQNRMPRTKSAADEMKVTNGQAFQNLIAKSGHATTTPACELAAADTNAVPDAASVARHQVAFDSLQSLCTEDESKLAAEIWAS